MSAATLSDQNPHTAIVQQGTRDRPTISWAAVIAGVAVSMATQLGLAELCLAAGLSLYTPFDPDSSPGKAGAVAVIAALVCMIAALFLGGWVAGRLAHFHSRTVASLHGLLVWALGALLAGALLASTLGMLAGGALSMVGDGLKGAATAVPGRRQAGRALHRRDPHPGEGGHREGGRHRRARQRTTTASRTRRA